MNETLKKSVDSVDKFLESDSGKAWLKERKAKEAREKRKLKKLHFFISHAKPQFLKTLGEKFFAWEKRYEDRLLKNHHAEGSSACFSMLISVFQKYGKHVENGIVDNHFIRKIAEIDADESMGPDEKIKKAIDYTKRKQARFAKENMFLSGEYEYCGYTLKIYSGQGCFYRVYIGNKQIW